MAAASLHPPRAPPDHLRLQSFLVLSRLKSIHAFEPWLEYTRLYVYGKRNHTPVELLWHCFSFGAPLCTLLNLLGSPSPPDLKHFPEDFDFAISIEGRESYFSSFIQRVQILEVQGRLTYGEVLRGEEFLSGTCPAFAKVLQTVHRLLVALQGTYPGLFDRLRERAVRRSELIQELLDTERVHVSTIKTMHEAVTSLSDGLQTVDPYLECLRIHHEQLLQYHNNLLQSFEEVSLEITVPQWSIIFALDDGIIRTRVFGAYRSICVNYLALVEFLGNAELESTLKDDAQIVIESLHAFLSRISDYCVILQDLLDVTTPIEDGPYNSLCEAVFRMSDISENMDEVGRSLRTVQSARVLKGRAYSWNAPDPDELGSLLLDDCITVDRVKDVQWSVFLFEASILCCREGPDISGEPQISGSNSRYPVKPWELGPALRRHTALDVVYFISTERLDNIICSDTSSIDIVWEDDQHNFHTLKFCSMLFDQWEQWVSLLQAFVPHISLPSVVPYVSVGDSEAQLSEDEDESGTRVYHTKSWSVIARKDTHSESSSFINQAYSDEEALIGQDVSPNRQSLISQTSLGSAEALFPINRPPTPPEPDSGSVPFNEPGLPDLTGSITRDGSYPSAHGGFSDVWKGIWHDGPKEYTVAVKVLRSRMDDPEMEEKMRRRMQRELDVWKNLDHPHIIRLYGTTSDFGPYSSMVCPWLEHGSVSKYMERCGDLVSTADRLRLLCEVADGLAYLHAHSIVHGDLTGSNILITGEGKACLCDFGLSNIVVECLGPSYFTSTIGGAVRWADPLLYRINSEEDEAPVVGMSSDIYSFGSVMLEILSGRIPYHYIRTDAQVIIELHRGNKPRRPALTFVSDIQWSLIERCWADDPQERPGIHEVIGSIQMLHSTCPTTR